MSIVSLSKIIKTSSKVIDLIIARKNKYHNNILFDNNYNFKSDNLLVYSLHINLPFIPEVIFKNINEYKKKSFDILIVITFSNLKFDDVKKISDSSFSDCRFIIRKNVGKDFGGFADAVDITDPLRHKKIIFQNDSIIGPLYEADYIHDLMSVDGEFIGVTESYGPSYHLQSSFLLFNGHNAISKLQDFFDEKYNIYNHRSNIVKYGEVGLTTYMLKNGVKTNALHPIHQLINNSLSHDSHASINGKSLTSINAQHYFAEILFTEKNYPFLKREIISKNPSNVKFSWENFIQKMGDSGLHILSNSIKSRN